MRTNRRLFSCHSENDGLSSLAAKNSICWSACPASKNSICLQLRYRIWFDSVKFDFGFSFHMCLLICRQSIRILSSWVLIAKCASFRSNWCYTSQWVLSDLWFLLRFCSLSRFLFLILRLEIFFLLKTFTRIACCTFLVIRSLTRCSFWCWVAVIVASTCIDLHALKLSDGTSPDNRVYVGDIAFLIQFSKCQINCAAWSMLNCLA